MQFNDDYDQSLKANDLTPATLSIAITFFALVGYFIIEHYFTATEYYAENPPYLAIVLAAAVGTVLVLLVLDRLEPERENSNQFALLMGLGVALAAYSFIPRLNVITDIDGLQVYEYTLDSDYIWQPNDLSLPKLDLYLKSSQWWRQYKPGDAYRFELRKGGLDIWQINMAKIYQEQKTFYDCDGVLSCMSK